jgi:3-oxoacyl-[acyl-carrier protein] reductase
MAFGSVDALVHCAGVMSTTLVMEIGVQEWERVMRIKLGATFFCAREALRYMCRQGLGRIVTISSSAGKAGGLAVGAHYAASKPGVICRTKTLAQFATPYHVLVNSVCPGSTRTPMAAAWSPEMQEALKAKIPLGRLAEAHEVAGAVCFFLSPLADFITGEILNINGGMVTD